MCLPACSSTFPHRRHIAPSNGARPLHPWHLCFQGWQWEEVRKKINSHCVNTLIHEMMGPAERQGLCQPHSELRETQPEPPQVVPHWTLVLKLVLPQVSGCLVLGGQSLKIDHKHISNPSQASRHPFSSPHSSQKLSPLDCLTLMQ